MNEYLTYIAFYPLDVQSPNAVRTKKCLLNLILSGQAYVQWELWVLPRVGPTEVITSKETDPWTRPASWSHFPRVGGGRGCTVRAAVETGLPGFSRNTPGRRPWCALNISLSHCFVEVLREEWGSLIHFLNPTPWNRRDRLNAGHLGFTELGKVFFKLVGFRTCPYGLGQVLVHWCLLRAMYSVYFWFVCPWNNQNIVPLRSLKSRKFFWILNFFFWALMKLTDVGDPSDHREVPLSPNFLATEKRWAYIFPGSFVSVGFLGLVSDLLCVDLIRKAGFKKLSGNQFFF